VYALSVIIHYHRRRRHHHNLFSIIGLKTPHKWTEHNILAERKDSNVTVLTIHENVNAKIGLIKVHWKTRRWQKLCEYMHWSKLFENRLHFSKFRKKLLPCYYCYSKER